MPRRVLITGGAGFIGPHVADELLSAGYEIRAFDSCAAQAHGRLDAPACLSPEVEYLRGDVRGGAALRERAVDRVEQADAELERRGLVGGLAA